MNFLNLRKLFLYLLIGSVVASALIGIAVVLFGDFGDVETRVLLTALTISATSVLGLACGAYIELRNARLIPVVGIISAAVSAVLWIILIWSGLQNDTFVRTLMSVTILGVSCALVSLLSIAKLDRRFIWSRFAVHATVWPLTVYLIVMSWNPNLVDQQISGRIMGVLGIAVAALTVLTPVLHKLSSNETDVDEIESEIKRLRARIAELESKKALVS